MKLRIIGGNPAGLSAASAAKKNHPNWDVMVYERSHFVSYASCGIPYYVEELIDDIHQLITISKENFLKDRNIPILTEHEVIKVDFNSKILKIRDLKTNQEFIDSFDKLVIATGAKPLVTGGLQIKDPRVFIIRNMENAMQIRDFLHSNIIQKIVIIGAGYIGLEMIEAYLHYKIKEIHLIAKSTIFDGKLGDIIKKEIESRGIIYHNDQVAEKIENINDKNLRVILSNGEFIEADMVQISIGVIPDTDLFNNTQLKMENGAIIVDRFLRTNIENVYAAGDCAVVYHRILRKNVYMPLAPTANKQGRIAGNHLSNIQTPEFPGIVGTAIFKVLNLYIGRTGISDAEAKEIGYDPDSVYIENNEIAHYYPGAKKLFLNLRFDKKSHMILGAEIIAPSPVGAKKIDVIATALYSGMRIDDLQSLDLAYAPPFGTVWDPILIAAEVAGKKLKIN